MPLVEGFSMVPSLPDNSPLAARKCEGTLFGAFGNLAESENALLRCAQEKVAAPGIEPGSHRCETDCTSTVLHNHVLVRERLRNGACAPRDAFVGNEKRGGAALSPAGPEVWRVKTPRGWSVGK